MAAGDLALRSGGSTAGDIELSVSGGSSDVLIVTLDKIEQGVVAITAAGMGGVLQE